MKCNKSVALSVWSAVLLVSMAFAVAGQTASEGSIANVVGGGAAIRWDVGMANAGGTLTINFPDGRSVRKAFKAGASPQFSVGDKGFENLSDGVYVYELRLAPQVSMALKESLARARGNDDDPESVRSARKRLGMPSMVQSGSFAVVNGSIVTAGSVEPEAARVAVRTRPTVSGDTIRRVRSHHFSLFTVPDQVIPDDLIVQGSACVGLDCVNNENFGFDTIRMKENNDRLQFDDTSTSAGFATNNWQIRANSSASGGASFLGFVDQGATGNSETGTIVFEVDAGAVANSLRVASNSNIGLGTATPVLDLHVNTTDTPAFRLEQNNTGGFTAQTWDIAGNEANFFVRDVTGGSRLPFRIRPGAPTSSIDISAAGDVGIGTASPNKSAVTRAITVNGSTDAIYEWSIADVRKSTMYHNGTILSITNNVNGALTLGTNNAERVRVEGGGNVGIGTTAPTALLSVNGTANKPGGGSWDVFSDERLKNIKGRFSTGLKAVMQLRPIRYEYKPDNALNLKSTGENIGFGAQELQKIIPEAVKSNQNGYLMVNNDPIMWTMLNAIQEQQKQIEQLKGEIRKLRRASLRRRR